MKWNVQAIYHNRLAKPRQWGNYYDIDGYIANINKELPPHALWLVKCAHIRVLRLK